MVDDSKSEDVRGVEAESGVVFDSEEAKMPNSAAFGKIAICGMNGGKA